MRGAEWCAVVYFVNEMLKLGVSYVAEHSLTGLTAA